MKTFKVTCRWHTIERDDFTLSHGLQNEKQGHSAMSALAPPSQGVDNGLSTAHTMRKHNQTQSLLQAANESPTLAQLSQLMRESTQRLRALDPLIPAALRTAIQAGPIEGNSWCLLVSSNSAAAKLRQMLPALQAHLQQQGFEVQTIRLKVLTR